MKHKTIYISLTAILILLLLAGCSNSKGEIGDNEKQASNIGDTVTVSETVNESTTIKETQPIEKESKFDLPNLPENFIEYSKYIGQDISIFEVDTNNWDFNAYSIEIGRASIFEISGTVSINIGWDKKTITDLFFHFDNEYLNGDSYSETSSKLELEFGKPVYSDIVQGITRYIINKDAQFSLTRNSMGICWSEENRTRFENSKPADSTHSETKPQKPAPAIGMTAEEVKNSSWGKPSDINKTTTAYGIHEQWVYSGNRYIYLDDGIVTAIQE